MKQNTTSTMAVIPVLVSGLLACACTGDREGRPIALPALTRAIEDHDNAIRVLDSTQTDFKAIWGPYSDSGVVVTATVYSPETGLTITSGDGDYFVYASGHFSNLIPAIAASPQFANQPEIKTLIWPIVYTSRVSVGATGTSFIIHFNSTTSDTTVIRLRQKNTSGQWAGGIVKVKPINPIGAAKEIPANLDTNQYVVCSAAGVITGPLPLGAAQQDIIDEVARRAPMRGVQLPVDAVGP